jgi:dsDNA-binding SOS-regulon protein
MAKKPTEPTQTNVSSELWAEASGVFVLDTNLIDRAKHILKRARDRRKKNQARYSEQGIPANMIAKFYDEADLSEVERTATYALEQIGRRALGLFAAESPEDFNYIMERASATERASAEGEDIKRDAAAEVDGFNGTFHGGQTRDDNPHPAGSRQYVAWDRGCKAAMQEMEDIERFFAIEPTKEGTILERDETAYRQGTQKRASRKQAAPAGEPTAGVFEMPDVPGLPA